MARCPHKNVQEFTETCLDCGRNIYETDEEYYKYLKKRKAEKDRNSLSDKIEKLESELGIQHAGNRPKCDHNYGNAMCACGGHCQIW